MIDSLSDFKTMTTRNGDGSPGPDSRFANGGAGAFK